MDPQGVITLAQQALFTAVLLSAPMLLASLVVGLVVSILQAATQINEMTLTFIPKLLAMIATLVIAGPWMITLFVDFLRRLYQSIPTTIG
jgi:flagellar biosynthetic protein FliQ